MARMTAEDMARLLRKAIGSPDESEFTDTDVLRCLNLAQEDIALALRPPDILASTTITTAANTETYELSISDELMILSVVDDTNDVRLYHINAQVYDWITQGDTETGQPEMWHEFGTGSNGRTQIRLHPTPDGTYSLRIMYIKTPTEMVLTPTATSPGLPRMYDEEVLRRAIDIARMFQGEIEPRQLGVKSFFERRRTLPVEIPLPVPTLLFDEINNG